jgi:hypothetical protein
MARIRNIKPDTFLDPDLAELGFAARYFFIGLWCHADREGRLRDEPKKLAIQILPFDIGAGKVDSETLLSELAPRFIHRYEVSGNRYIQVVNFCRHQRPHPNEQPSNLPQESGKVCTSHEITRQGTTKVVPRTLYKGKGEGNGDRKGDGEGNGVVVRFAPPTLQEVQTLCNERKNSVDAEKFHSYYEANGWRVGRNPMKDWRAAVRTWERNDANNANGKRIVGDAAPVRGKYAHLG